MQVPTFVPHEAESLRKLDSLAGLSTEQQYFVSGLSGAMANEGFTPVEALPNLPEDHTWHYTPYEAWQLSGHLHSPETGTVYVHWVISKRYHEGKAVFLSRCNVGDTFARFTRHVDEYLVHVRSNPFEVVVGAESRMQSKYSGVLFPMVIENHALQATLTRIKEPEVFLRGDYGVAEAGYVYPSVEVNGVLDAHTVVGELMFRHTWSYGVENPTYPPAFLHRAMRAASQQSLSYVSPARAYVFLDNLQIVWRNNEDADVWYEDGSFETRTMRLDHDGHMVHLYDSQGFNLTWTDSHVVSTILGTSWQEHVHCGQVTGTHTGYALYVVEEAQTRHDEIERLVGVEAPQALSPSTAQTAGAIAFWSVPFVLFVIIVVLVVLLAKATGIFTKASSS